MPAQHEIQSPSPWVVRWSALIRPGGEVLDVACGSGRHTRYLASHGYGVVAVDRDDAALAALAAVPRGRGAAGGAGGAPRAAGRAAPRRRVRAGPGGRAEAGPDPAHLCGADRRRICNDWLTAVPGAGEIR